jgi:hypothetical protein
MYMLENLWGWQQAVHNNYASCTHTYAYHRCLKQLRSQQLMQAADTTQQYVAASKASLGAEHGSEHRQTWCVQEVQELETHGSKAEAAEQLHRSWTRLSSMHHYNRSLKS